MARIVEFDQELAVRRAMEVFWEKGYKGASLRDLTKAMQINPSSLYNTIGDKQELFVRCIRRYTDDRKEYIAQHAASSRSPLQTLKLFLDDAVTNVITGERSCLAIKAAFEVAGEDERIKSILKDDEDAMYRFLRSLLAKAMKQGEIRKEDPELITDYLLSAYTGWHESFILHRDPVKIQRMARYVLKQLSR
ncbi:TetR/AcrR family transcriptional regulator [Silvibacterium acidisoli]|uniref:TetR/AcrR family transcriptional regulator n=1 Tax=Acidobacteriaceae bacterium ZG23-2 TaxID=2883246 RepID=UPI00406C235D